MKKLIVIIFTSLLFISCENQNEILYSYKVQYVVPDSLNERKEKFIIELVSASSFHLSAGDYESPEYVIIQARKEFDEMYAVPIEGLNIRTNQDYYPTFVPYDKLNSEQMEIFHKLKSNTK